MEIQDLGLEITTSFENEKHLKSEAKCIKNKLSTLACNNSTCSEYAFVCDDKKCECRQKHKKCLFTDIEQIIQLIEEKRAESTDVIEKVSNVLENWIDEISKTREKIESLLRDWGLSPVERTFISILKNHNFSQLTGNHINQITTKTVEYFTEETKERLLLQIETLSKNYDSEIKSIMKTTASLFEKYSIDEKETGFKDKEVIEVDIEDDFLPKLEKKLKEYQKPIQKEHYDDFILYFKQSLKEDFSAQLKKYQKSRRAYGTKKLRLKYFDDYFIALTKGEYYIKKWEEKTKEQLSVLNKIFERECHEFGDFYRESDGFIEKPFTPEIALSLQKTINTIYMLVEYVKENGKEMVREIFDQSRRLNENFELIMYFLDGLMDSHPEIDEIETVWNVIRFENKLKDEVNYLYETVTEIVKDPYELEIKCIKE